jgi:protein-S-isoprenylcysteine O-methyltransferase Ste14
MSVPATATLAAWALLELGVRVSERLRGKGGGARDRATRALIAISIAAALAGARAATAVVPWPQASGGPGIAVVWLGLGLRLWAIAALGRAFRTTVEVDRDQPVVTSGPYKRIRHPSYTGLLLIIAGFGLALGSAVALVVALLVPLAAIVRRIRVEEAELERVLGDPYRRYEAGTSRLVPGLW